VAAHENIVLPLGVPLLQMACRFLDILAKKLSPLRTLSLHGKVSGLTVLFTFVLICYFLSVQAYLLVFACHRLFALGRNFVIIIIIILRPTLHKEVVESRNIAPQQNSSRSHAEVANSTTHSRTPTQAVESQRSYADYGVIVVPGMHKKDRLTNKVSGEDSEGFTSVS
jgi:hypothetical protein